jgi:hypothetical protein
VRVVTNELYAECEADYHENPVLPEVYERFAGRHEMSTVVSAPWPRLLDLALPLAMRFATTAVCMFVPGQYLANAPPARAAFLEHYTRMGRVRKIYGAPVDGPVTQAGVWICVFAKPEFAQEMVRQRYQQTDSSIYIS